MAAAGGTGSAIGDRYDMDNNGEIEIGETRTAVSAYFRDEITIEDARAVVALYFASP